MEYFVHPQGICESLQVGSGTRVWAFAHVLKGAKIGSDCNICDHTFIEDDVILGDRVTVKCGVQLWNGARIEDDVFIGPNVTFTNDLFPRSKKTPEKFLQTILRKGSSIGANATLLPGLEIGEYAMIGAGSVVTKSVPAYTLVAGNPAKVIGLVDTEKKMGNKNLQTIDISIRNLHVVRESRGDIFVGQFEAEVPFQAKRFFMICDVPAGEIRGRHAHKICHQFLICVKGSCLLTADDGKTSREFLLNTPEKGIHLPPLTWGVQSKYSSDAILLVFASHAYDKSDYISDYSEFLRLTRDA